MLFNIAGMGLALTIYKAPYSYQYVHCQCYRYGILHIKILVYFVLCTLSRLMQKEIDTILYNIGLLKISFSMLHFNPDIIMQLIYIYTYI